MKDYVKIFIQDVLPVKEILVVCVLEILHWCVNFYQGKNVFIMGTLSLILN